MRFFAAAALTLASTTAFAEAGIPSDIGGPWLSGTAPDHGQLVPINTLFFAAVGPVSLIFDRVTIDVEDDTGDRTIAADDFNRDGPDIISEVHRFDLGGLPPASSATITLDVGGDVRQVYLRTSTTADSTPPTFGGFMGFRGNRRFGSTQVAAMYSPATDDYGVAVYALFEIVRGDRALITAAIARPTPGQLTGSISNDDSRRCFELVAVDWAGNESTDMHCEVIGASVDAGFTLEVGFIDDASRSDVTPFVDGGPTQPDLRKDAGVDGGTAPDTDGDCSCSQSQRSDPGFEGLGLFALLLLRRRLRSPA